MFFVKNVKIGEIIFMLANKINIIFAFLSQSYKIY
jgi:hypothetical protein